MAVFIHSTGGGVDISKTTAEALDVLSGKKFFLSDGSEAVGAIPGISAGEHMPGVNDITLQKGVYLLGDQVIKGDQNLLPENIKSGVNLFGVTGTFSFSTKSASGTFSGYTLKVTTGFRPLGVILSTSNSVHEAGDIIMCAGIYSSGGAYISGCGMHCYDDNGQRHQSGGGYISVSAAGFEWSASTISTNDGYVDGYMRSGRWIAVGI